MPHVGAADAGATKDAIAVVPGGRTDKNGTAIADKSKQSLIELSVYLRMPERQSQAIFAAVRHFAHRYVCSPIVGDAALRNVLIDVSDAQQEHRAIGIDYEEDRTGDDSQRRAEVEQGFFAMLRNGKKWARDQEAAMLESLLLHKGLFEEHLAWLDTRWQRVAELIVETGMESLVDESSMRARLRLLRAAWRALLLQHEDERPVKRARIQVPTASAVATTIDASDDASCPTVAAADMRYSFRQAISVHGHCKDVLLSALQKYIRRGMRDAAAYVAAQLERFSALAEARPLVTNAVNRLRVALPEETAGIASPALTVVFDAHYRTFEALRTSTDDAGALARRRAFLSMVLLLVAAPKQRLVSDIKAVYFNRAAPTAAASDEQLRRLYDAKMDIDHLQCAAAHSLVPGDSVNVRDIADGLITAIRCKSDIGFRYMATLLHLMQQKQISVGKRSIGSRGRADAHPMYVAFHIFTLYAQRGARLWDRSAAAPSAEWTSRMLATLDVCFDYFRHFGYTKSGKPRHRDCIVFYIWPALYCFREVDFERNAPASIGLTDAEIDNLYGNDAKRRELDDFVLDQHTAHGRSMGRGALHFANVGALVCNEDRSLYNELYRRMYVLLKSK